MRTSVYIKRLRRDLPYWMERGWVKSGSEQHIIQDVVERAQQPQRLYYALSILGAVLLGMGIITWFAANWPYLPKISKLIILIGSMWAAYFFAWYFLRMEHARRTGEALLLLAVMLFGANIMLIGQIYHLEVNYLHGVLLWALGALLIAYLLKSQPAMVAAIVLGMLWTGLVQGGDIWGFLWNIVFFEGPRNIHWEYLLLWAVCIPLINRANWRASMHLSMIGLLFWGNNSYHTLGTLYSIAGIYIVELYILVFLALFLCGLLMATYARTERFAGLIQHYGLFASLYCMYVLTFPRLHKNGYILFGGDEIREAASAGWIAALLIMLVLVVVLAQYHRLRTLKAGRPAYLVWGQALIAVFAVLMLINMFVSGKYGGEIAIGFNLLFFTGLIWLMYAGMQRQDRFFINIAFVFFALGLLSRYFDTFWTLMNRAYFFMLGGAILTLAGYYLEKQRRRLMGQIKAHHGGDAS